MRRIAALLLLGISGAVGATTYAPYAFGQSAQDPLGAIWDAIQDLQRHDDNLQAQIDDLKATKLATSAKSEQPIADPSVSVNIEEKKNSSNEISIHVRALNNGADRAVGVRISVFYKMSALQVENISGEGCRDLSRGIIVCDVGTLESGGESVVSIDARQVDGHASTLTVDLSSITADSDPTNNRDVRELQFSTETPIAKDGAGSKNNTVTDSGSEIPGNDNNSTSESEQSQGQTTDQGGKVQANETSDSEEGPQSQSGNSTSSETQGSGDQPVQDPSSLDENSSESGSDSSDNSSNDSDSNSTSEDHSDNETSDESGSGKATPLGNQTSG
jgi:hypothetical protein